MPFHAIHCVSYSLMFFTHSMFNEHQTQTTPETGRNLLLKMRPETYFLLTQWFHESMIVNAGIRKCKAWKSEIFFESVTLVRLLWQLVGAVTCTGTLFLSKHAWQLILLSTYVNMMNTCRHCSIGFHTRKTTGTKVLAHSCKFPIYILHVGTFTFGIC